MANLEKLVEDLSGLTLLEAAELTKEHVIAQQAQELAETVAARARRDAEGVQREADEYVLDVLQQLEADLGRTLTVVRNGVEKVQRDLKSRWAEQAEDQPPAE